MIPDPVFAALLIVGGLLAAIGLLGLAVLALIPERPPVEPERLVAERSVREGWNAAGEGADRIWTGNGWAA